MGNGWYRSDIITTTYAITTNVVSSNPDQGEVYSIQHYVIKFVSDLRQVGGFLMVPAVREIIRKKQEYIKTILYKGRDWEYIAMGTH
jgi:hypothetical protein